MIETSIRCDICGASKPVSGQWYSLMLLECSGASGFMVLAGAVMYGGSANGQCQLRHCCGQRCLLETISSLLGNNGGTTSR